MSCDHVTTNNKMSSSLQDSYYQSTLISVSHAEWRIIEMDKNDLIMHVNAITVYRVRTACATI